MKYQIYFRVFNRKMQVTIEANSPADADKKLRGKIQVDRVEPIEAKMPEMPEQFKEFFSNIFGGGK